MMQTNKKRGFSIGEVLIASFVIMVGITATSILLAKSIKNTIDARNLVIAAQLAQEGAELVRNVRDNNVVSNFAAFQGFPSGSQNCRIDYASALSCPNATTRLRYVNNFYRHTTGTSADDTMFYRRITISGSGSERTVTSTVVWGQSSFPANCTIAARCVATVSTLTDWLE